MLRMFMFTAIQTVSVRTEIQTQSYMVVIFFILCACVHKKIHLVWHMFLVIPRICCEGRRSTKHSVYFLGLATATVITVFVDSCHFG